MIVSTSFYTHTYNSNNMCIYKGVFKYSLLPHSHLQITNDTTPEDIKTNRQTNK